MRISLSLIAAVTLAAAVGCAPSSVEPTSFPASYKMMETPGNFPLVDDCAAVSKVMVHDARSDKSYGKRYLEESPGTTQPITMEGDVEAWVREGILEAFSRSTLEADTKGKPELHVRIQKIVLDEAVYRNAEYDGTIVLEFELRKPGASRACWSGKTQGFSENYGSSAKAENYQETINHALDKAVLDLIQNKAFRDQLCKGC